MTRNSRRLWCLVLTVVMMVTLLPAAIGGNAALAEEKQGKTIKDAVNFREGPSMKDPYLFRLPVNTVLPVLEKVTANDYDWYKVQSKDPTSQYNTVYTGYIRGDCFRMLSESESSGSSGSSSSSSGSSGSSSSSSSSSGSSSVSGALGYVMTIKGSVNIRASAGGTSLTTVGKYETFPYLLAPVKKGGYTWYFVQVKSNLKGYIRGDCVKVVKDPGNSSSSSSSSTTPSSSSATPSGKLKTTIDYVNIRKGIWGDVITVCKKAGTEFPYYGEPIVKNGIKWYNIYDKSFGYAFIHGNYVKVTSSTAPEDSSSSDSSTPSSGGTVSPSSSGKTEASYTTLKTGSSGQAVRNLVTELKNQGYYKYAITSNYTSSVETAVRNFQKAKGLGVDGIAGPKTQHALYNTVPIGTADHSNYNMTLYPAEKIDWDTGGIQELWPKGANVKVYDVYTGIVWWAHRWSGGLHVDAEPLTATDTARLCQAYGVSKASEISSKNLWERRPCLVTIGTRTFACSLYGVPHNLDGDTIPDNNYAGQLCIHFTNSKVHESKKVDTYHQEAIDYAWKNAPNGHK